MYDKDKQEYILRGRILDVSFEKIRDTNRKREGTVQRKSEKEIIF